MMEILPTPDHVAAFRIAGRLDGRDYEAIASDVRAKLARHERIGVLVDLTDFEDITPEAAWKDIRFSLSLIGDLKRFPREAVVSDRQWVRTLAKIADPLLPHVTIRVFGSAERDAALAWVAETPRA
ncbi:MAG TPA: STAS/SEC14 domain-containing protein [Gemmatimonadales bacterium]